MLIAWAPIFVFRIWPPDISQTYLQSAEGLLIKVYFNMSEEFQPADDQLFKLLKPLYGLTDASEYRGNELTRYLTTKLNISPIFLETYIF